VSRLVAETAAVLERVVRNPAVLSDVMRKTRSRLTAARHQRRLVEYAGLVEAPWTGLAKVLGMPVPTIVSAVETDGFRGVLAELHAYEAPAAARRMGGGAFLEALYAIVRLTRPQVILETGVAHGYSSAVILQGIADNGRGRLSSIDLPMFRPGVVSYTGDAVPDRLRAAGWDLHLGSDRRVLPGLLKQIGPVEFLFYDSDTAYEAMLHTWELVWPYLRPGAVVAMNIVHANDAYLEFAERHRLPPVIIPAPKRQGAYLRARGSGERISYLGFLRKPAA